MIFIFNIYYIRKNIIFSNAIILEENMGFSRTLETT